MLLCDRCCSCCTRAEYRRSDVSSELIGVARLWVAHRRRASLGIADVSARILRVHAQMSLLHAQQCDVSIRGLQGDREALTRVQEECSGSVLAAEARELLQQRAGLRSDSS